MLPALHAHLQSVFVVIILSHDGRLKGILSLLSRQHHQRSHGQGCSLQPDTRQVLSRLNVQVRLFTRNGMLRYIPILGNDSNLLIVFYVQIMPDDFVMQLHRF